MRQVTNPGAVAAAAAATEGVLMRLRGLLTRPIRLERRGIDWHFVLAPLPRATAVDGERSAASAPRKRDAMPSLTNDQVAEVCANLRAVLGGEHGRHPRMPSLALLERALHKNGVRGIDEVPACVLRHAAQSLDAIDLDQYGPGLVVLRRRVGQVLRRRHGDGRPREAIPQPVLRPCRARRGRGSAARLLRQPDRVHRPRPDVRRPRQLRRPGAVVPLRNTRRPGRRRNWSRSAPAEAGRTGPGSRCRSRWASAT